MPERVSMTMSMCLDFVRSNGGVVDRQPGGFWGYQAGVWFGASTIDALVVRGLLEYSGWQRGRGDSSFPIQAKLVDVTKI